eukprot:5916739-Pleurochrysis_carterae.AAC.2
MIDFIVSLDNARREAAKKCGPMNEFLFVGPSDCGKGLFARADLVAGQVDDPARTLRFVHLLVSRCLSSFQFVLRRISC